MEIRQLKILRSKYSVGVFFLCLLLCWLCGCGHLNRAEFSKPFDLCAFVAENIEQNAANIVNYEFEFRIVDRNDSPVPHGLIRFDWVDAGRMSLQTDEEGMIRMRFEPDILEFAVIVSAETKPTGQDLLKADYESSTQPLIDGRIHVSWK